MVDYKQRLPTPLSSLGNHFDIGVAMSRLPRTACEVLRPATSHEIQSWSFGAVARVVGSREIGWSDLKGTLEDQAIFGPLLDYECACKKYHGRQFAQNICEICGVKIESRKVRWERFGHINFSIPIQHDVCETVHVIEAFPVLPASIRESPCARGLDALCEELLKASQATDVTATEEAYRRICEALIPVVVMAVDWNLHDARVLARGLGLCFRG